MSLEINSSVSSAGVAPDTCALLTVRLILDAPSRELWFTDVRCAFVPYRLVAARVFRRRSAFALVSLTNSLVAARHRRVASGAVLTGRNWRRSGFLACGPISLAESFRAAWHGGCALGASHAILTRDAGRMSACGLVSSAESFRAA